ncbi:N-6 DNA methylase, partial [Klebsiella pneumoniae]
APAVRRRWRWPRLPALRAGTGIPAAILIFKEQKVDDKVLFIDASREFKAGKNQNQLSEENIKKIVKTYRDGDNVEKYAYLASLKEI